jgi:tellurium resistance protein TerD
MSITLNLSKNAPLLDLHKEAPSLTTLRASLSWTEHPVHGADLSKGFDLDLFAIVLTGEKIRGPQDIVYFHNMSYDNGSIVLPADNRTGGGDGEHIDIVLGKVPAERTGVDLYVCIHEAAERRQHFGMMADAKFVLATESGATIQEYSVSSYPNKAILHIGRLERNGATWAFSPSGETSDATINEMVSAYM